MAKNLAKNNRPKDKQKVDKKNRPKVLEKVGKKIIKKMAKKLKVLIVYDYKHFSNFPLFQLFHVNLESKKLRLPSKGAASLKMRKMYIFYVLETIFFLLKIRTYIIRIKTI